MKLSVSGKYQFDDAKSHGDFVIDGNVGFRSDLDFPGRECPRTVFVIVFSRDRKIFFTSAL